MNIERARFNMVEQQIRPWDVLDMDVLNLLHVVKRERFVPVAYKSLAFADTEIPLNEATGARMLVPRVEARILQSLKMKPHEKVLQIGTGSGYMAALLGAHADRVWSVEIDPGLAETARASLERAGVTNVTVRVGNGLVGLLEQASFDVIMISGAVAEIPQTLLSQVKPGGRLFAFVGTAPAMQARLLTRSGNQFKTTVLFETVVETLTDPAVASTFSF